MKKIIGAFCVVLILCSATFISGDGGKVPSVTVKKLDGSKISTGTFSNDGKPMIINFWATWCKPCKQELNAIAEVYEDWQKETGVKLIAIATDDARSVSKVPNDVKSKDWPYEVYTDENGDFQRAMNVNNPPFTFIIDGKGNIVYSHNSYVPGDENILYENLKKVAKGEKIDH